MGRICLTNSFDGQDSQLENPVSSSYRACGDEEWGQQEAVGESRVLLWLRIDVGSKQHGN